MAPYIPFRIRLYGRMRVGFTLDDLTYQKMQLMEDCYLYDIPAFLIGDWQSLVVHRSRFFCADSVMTTIRTVAGQE